MIVIGIRMVENIDFKLLAFMTVTDLVTEFMNKGRLDSLLYKYKKRKFETKYDTLCDSLPF